MPIEESTTKMRRKLAKKRDKKLKKELFKRGSCELVVPLLSTADIRRIRLKELFRSQRAEDTESGENADDDTGLESIRKKAMEQWEREKQKTREVFKKTSMPANYPIIRQMANDNSNGVASNRENADIQSMANDLEALLDESDPITPAPPPPKRPLFRVVRESDPNTPAPPPAKRPLFRVVQESDEICKFCSHSCGRHSPLPMHLEKQHQFRCETCVLEFANKGDLRKHRQHHQTKHRCDVCGRDFAYFLGYKKHCNGRQHLQLVAAQTKVYNAFVKGLEPLQLAGVQLMDDDCSVISAGNSNGPVKVYDGQVIDFLNEQIRLHGDHVEYKEDHGTVDASVQIDWHPPRSRVSTPAPIIQQVVMAECEIRNEILVNGRDTTVEQISQALTLASDEVVGMAYDASILERPTAINTADGQLSMSDAVSNTGNGDVLLNDSVDVLLCAGVNSSGIDQTTFTPISVDGNKDTGVKLPTPMDVSWPGADLNGSFYGDDWNNLLDLD